MSKKQYQVKSRPNPPKFYDPAIIDAILNGGGNLPNVQREAYWAKPPTEEGQE